MLLIDSSHVAVPGSDVDQLLNTVLPELATGVLVHLHDIFLPDRYPADWTWRGYNEQVAVGCLLQGGGYAVRLASHYLATRHAIAPGRGPRRSAASFSGCTGVQSLAGEAADERPYSGATLNRRRRRCPAGTGRSGPAAPS